MYMKNPAFLEQLQQELPRRNLSEKATQRFEDTYRMLGVQQEAPVRRRHKALWVTATAACLCCGLMFGINAAFPAFAENLPGIGRFFQSNSGPFSSTGKSPVGKFLDTYDQVQTVNVSASSGQYTLDVLDAFCDGEMVSFSMDLGIPQEGSENYSWLAINGGYDEPDKNPSVTVNGKRIFLDSYNSGVLYAQGNGHFVGSATFHLPQSQKHGEKLSIELSIPTAWARVASAKGGIGETEFLPYEPGLHATFNVTVDASLNKSFSCQAEDGSGTVIHAVESTPFRTGITLTFPYFGFRDGTGAVGDPVLLTLDGQEIDFSLNESSSWDGPGDYDPFFTQKEAQDCTLYFAGVPAGTQQFVFRIYEDKRKGTVLSEFTIDLESKTVTPSTTYQDGGALDVNSPFFYDSISWYSSSGDFGEQPVFTNGLSLHSVQAVYQGVDSPGISVSLWAEDEYRDIQVTAYNKEGQEVGSQRSENATYDLLHGDNYFMRPEDQERQPTKFKCSFYRMKLEGTRLYQPADGEVLTFVVSDANTGEELLRQDVTLEDPND